MRGAIARQIIACVAALVAALPVRAEEAEKKAAPLRVAVFDVRATGVDDATARTISEVLAVEVSKVPNTSVITNAEIESLLGLERKKQVLGCSDDVSCVAEIAGSLGVDKICTGSLGKISETTILTLRIIDVKSAKVDNRLYEKEKTDASGFLERMPDIVGKLFNAGKPEPKAEPKPEAKADPEPASFNPSKPYVSPPATPSAPPSPGFWGYAKMPKTWAVVGGVFLAGALVGVGSGWSASSVGSMATLGVLSGGVSLSLCVCSFAGGGDDEPAVPVLRYEPPTGANDSARRE